MIKKGSDQLKDLFHQAQLLLEFDKILEITSEYAISSDAKTEIFALLKSKLNQHPEQGLILLEQLSFFLKDNQLIINAYENLDSEIEILSIQDSNLSIESFQKIYKLCLNVTQISKLTVSKLKQSNFEKLYEFILKFPDLFPAHKEIRKIFDDDFNIHDHASADLHKIRMGIKSLEKSIYRSFKNELESLRSKSVLAEGEESIRNGRYVLRVLAEHKRKIQGIIVDESDSGKTFFIEPQVCLELNNELKELELTERREIFKILFELTGKLRHNAIDFRQSYQLMVQLDVLVAKARFAITINAIRPMISGQKQINIKNAIHPLLLLKLKEKGKVPVSLNFNLEREDRILLISGPNAGGKTIVLKTMGLLQIMLQREFLIPVHRNSIVPVFNDIWIDMGDRQSLDDGLSTYSARLSHMKILVESVNEDSLVLIDELGSGTEPIIGGAIAESILAELIHLGSHGIITTHYANLKAFAHKTKGIINGAMVYDEKNMEPKYLLQIGKPGSSYALDIAYKLEFPKSLIQYAKQKAGKQIVNMESLISKLEEEKSDLEAKNMEYLAKINSLNKLIKAYDNIQKQYEIKRLKLKLDSKQLELQQHDFLKEESVKLMNEIKEKLDIIKAKQLQEEIIKKTKQLSSELNAASNEYTDLLKQGQTIQDIKTGDKVHLIHHNMTGLVSEIGAKTATVITEHLTLKVNKSELSPVEESLIRPPSKNIKYNLIENSASFSNTLDLRGQSPEAAVSSMEIYLDKALMSNLKEVKIVHGKGTGTLRKAIHQSLRKNKFISSFKHPDEENGGSGITLAELK
jgi:DNA mismatch repair protein MutS2